MNQDIIFIPLGGGQRVGASCYYLHIGDANIILDAGVGIENGVEFEPDFHFLLTSPFMQSIGQINQIFISHAHMDHVGYLLKLMGQTSYSDVYMTEITKILSEYQLYDRLFIGEQTKGESARLAARSLLERIVSVSFMQTMDFGKYKVTFYPAGHIPGAMMILFEVGRRKILYTGDYSLDSTVLTPGCILPKGMDIDLLIMCGLHAKHPEYTKKTDALFRKASYVLGYVCEYGCSVMCQISQLSKGVEFLKQLNDRNLSGIPIYLDRSVMGMVAKMEQLSIPILNQYNKMVGDTRPTEPHIYLTSNNGFGWSGFYRTMKIDFSLHEDFSEMKAFLKNLNPRKAVVVHCGKEHSVFDNTIEQEMMCDGECRTQFIFAEEREIYKL